MKLDVVVPTYNRSQMVQLTITSLLEAPIPAGLEVTILVVDNNSKDDTEKVVREISAQSDRPVVYVKETKQGLSHARNAGILAGTGDLIGFIDDDEEVHADWYNVVARELADQSTQFIGGPCLPNWGAPPPSWLPPGYNGVIGVIDPKPRMLFGPAFPGNLNGGNAVLRRAVFEKVGMYNTKLGRSGKGLLSDEDAELYRRILSADIRGFHAPDLIIYHLVPASRLTRKYHRRWCYWRAVSQGVLDRESTEAVPYSFGIPRYRIGRALRGLLSLPKHLLSRQGKGLAFADELATWDLCGFVYGKYFLRLERYYGKQ
jgi:glycosyltransferase involved in cell wall biosynthesis